jgi:hypothetical protein
VILNALQHLSVTNFYGVTTMIDVLRGTESKKIFDANLNAIPEFGS